MEAGSRVLGVAFAFCTLLALVPNRAAASHHVFSSSLDRFEADGNVFGPSGGGLDYVDDFNNGVLGPDWSVLLGTAIEQGGVVEIKSPGTDIAIGTALIDVSNIEEDDEISDGLGNLTASTYWVPNLPVPGAEFHFQLYGIGATIESAGLSVGNGSAGPFVTEQLTQIVFPTSFTNVISEAVPINPIDITGSIVLRIAVNDSANTAVGSFSLDGGSTFQSPFSPMPIFSVVSSYEALAGAGVIEAITPGPTPTPTPPPGPQMIGAKLISVKNPGGTSARSIKYKGKRNGGVFLQGNPYGSGTSFHLKLDSYDQCFSLPPFLWRTVSHGYKYQDRFGAYGPVQLVKVLQSNNGIFQIKVKITGQNGPVNVIPPNPGIQADTNLSLGGALYCSSSAGALIKPNDAKTFKAKNASPPVACNIPACP